MTDQRQKNLAEYLPGKKVLLDWHNTQKKGAVEELVENCGYFIFPTPVSKLNRYPKLEDMLKYELINEKHEDKTVIGGGVFVVVGGDHVAQGGDVFVCDGVAVFLDGL